MANANINNPAKNNHGDIYIKYTIQNCGTMPNQPMPAIQSVNNNDAAVTMIDNATKLRRSIGFAGDHRTNL